MAARIEAIEGQRGQFEPAPAPRHQSSPTRPVASLGQSSSSIFDSLATEIPAVLGWAIELCSSLGGQSIIKGEPSVQSLGKQDIGLVSVSRAVSTSAGPPSPLIWPTRRTLCSRPQILSVPCCVSRHLHIVPVSRARFLTASLRRVGPEFIVPLEELHCHQQLINGDHRARGFGRELNIDSVGFGRGGFRSYFGTGRHFDAKRGRVTVSFAFRHPLSRSVAANFRRRSFFSFWGKNPRYSSCTASFCRGRGGGPRCSYCRCRGFDSKFHGGHARPCCSRVHDHVWIRPSRFTRCASCDGRSQKVDCVYGTSSPRNALRQRSRQTGRL